MITGTMFSSICDKEMKYTTKCGDEASIQKKSGDEAGNYVTQILQNDWYGWLQNTNLTMTIKGVILN
jgi:hypothetical protein